jgi:hypothetical protein
MATFPIASFSGASGWFCSIVPYTAKNPDAIKASDGSETKSHTQEAGETDCIQPNRFTESFWLGIKYFPHPREVPELIVRQPSGACNCQPTADEPHRYAGTEVIRRGTLNRKREDST